MTEKLEVIINDLKNNLTKHPKRDERILKLISELESMLEDK